jgi:pSer/pThr/pTyr-binding forkhead associated (FHA) protein
VAVAGDRAGCRLTLVPAARWNYPHARRAQGADFIIEAPLVSRLHCRIDATDDVLTVTDLASTNGTFVNGERIGARTVREGDHLRIGRVDFTVSRVDA